MCIAHRPGTITRGVQGTAIVGERARTMAFPTWEGLPPRSSVRTAAVTAAPAPSPSMLQPVVSFPARKMLPIFRMRAVAWAIRSRE